VLAFTEKVNRFYDEHQDLPPLATLCVYPNFAKIVSESLEVDTTEIACVSGGFPSSQTFLDIKTIETALAIKDGATEIDMVLSVGAFLSGDYETCSDDISELKAVCGEVPLKVILETGALQTAANIKKAAVMSMYAGADFIKTSTGKISVSATPESAYVMCKAIKEYKAQRGRWVGFKAAGGIKTVEDAIMYYTIVRETLGQEFIDKNLFRIGTSSLANHLVNSILGEEVNPF
jgi:deoxyribose-phosphate aldolase